MRNNSSCYFKTILQANEQNWRNILLEILYFIRYQGPPSYNIAYTNVAKLLCNRLGISTNKGKVTLVRFKSL